MVKTEKHPCFSEEAKGKYGRVHLPVAPKCNVQCNFCNRKFDCVNESRPGVSSAILSPYQALDYLRQITKKGVDISVVGIAGPGDPMANPDEVFETLSLVRKEFPEMIICLSSNGIDLPQHIQRIKELEVSHVTITVNGIDPEILSSIYSWVRFDKHMYRGLAAGKLIAERQEESILLLKEAGITVKVNSIILPGYNDNHIETIARKVISLGADLMNCIPVIPNKDTAFEDIESPSKQLMHELKEKVTPIIPQMKHCTRCRADAAGLLGNDLPMAMDLIRESARKPLFVSEKRPYVAVASHEGMLVNQHLGEAEYFLIYEDTPSGYRQIDKRKAPPSGSGDMRWIMLAKELKDCNSVLVSGAGPNPTLMLKSMGIKVILMNGLIELGLDSVYKGASVSGYVSTSNFKCGDSCRGNGMGCG